MKPQTHLVLPDVHLPFHDKHMLRAWLQDVVATKPTAIHILGDLMDCYQGSGFDKNPARKATLQDELDEARILLEEIRDLAGNTCDIRYSEGNHEARLTKLLWRSRELAPIRNLTIPQLLRLDDLNITYYGPKSPYRLGGLTFLHGDVVGKSNWGVSPGGYAATAILRSKGESVVMGHTHKMGHVCSQPWQGKLEGFECGCLCRFDLDYVVDVPPWQHGWAVIDFTHSGYYDVSFVRSCAKSPRSRRTLVFQGEELCTLPPAKVNL